MICPRHLLLSLCCLALAACGGAEGTVEPTPAPGATTSAAASTDLVPEGTSLVTITTIPHLPQTGPVCPLNQKYTIDLTASTLTNTSCAAGSTTASDATTTLTAAHSAAIVTALHGLRVDTVLQQHCGDDPDEILTLHAPAADRTLYGEFRYCSNDGKTYVTGTSAVLDAVAAALP